MAVARAQPAVASVATRIVQAAFDAGVIASVVMVVAVIAVVVVAVAVALAA